MICAVSRNFRTNTTARVERSSIAGAAPAPGPPREAPNSAWNTKNLDELESDRTCARPLVAARYPPTESYQLALLPEHGEAADGVSKRSSHEDVR